MITIWDEITEVIQTREITNLFVWHKTMNYSWQPLTALTALSENDVTWN